MTEAAVGDAEIARALACRYARGLDRLNRELLRSCFHDDAAIDMGEIYRGPPDGFVEVAMQFMGAMEATRHMIGNVLRIGAGYECYVDAWHLIAVGGVQKELMVRGRYLQIPEERDGHWALAAHSEVIDFGCERPVDPSWFEGSTGLPRGSRGPADPSFAFARDGVSALGTAS